MENTLLTVHLHGFLGDTFGKAPIKCYGKDLTDITRYLVSRFGVKMRNMLENGNWHIIKGKKESEQVTEEDLFLSQDMLTFPLDQEDVHIFPEVSGAGGKGGVLQIIIGVVLIVAAIVLTVFFPPAGAAALFSIGSYAVSSTAASLALAGIMSIAGGVASMLTKNPSMSSYESANAGIDQKPSFLFNGVINNTEQGVPIPLVYGRHLTGSTVIQAGIDTYQI